MKDRPAAKAWEPGETVTNLSQVWSYAKTEILAIKQQVEKIRSHYYGYQQKSSHDSDVCRRLSQVTNERDFSSEEASGEPAGVHPELKEWFDRAVATGNRLRDVHRSVDAAVVRPLTNYCSDYRAVGVHDNRLYTLFRSKMIRVPKVLSSVEEILSCLPAASSTLPRLLSTLSGPAGAPIALPDCECGGGHTLTKVVPAALATFTEALDLCHNWVISDQVYVNELLDSKKKAEKELLDLDKELRLAKAAHRSRLSVLREDQTVLELLRVDLKTYDKRKMATTKRAVNAVTLEITALEKVIKDIESECEDLDVPDCCCNETFFREDGDKPRYQKRLEAKRRKLGDLTKYLTSYDKLKEEIAVTTNKVVESEKLLKSTRIKRDKLQRLQDSCQDKLTQLGSAYRRRLYPATV